MSFTFDCLIEEEPKDVNHQPLHINTPNKTEFHLFNWIFFSLPLFD